MLSVSDTFDCPILNRHIFLCPIFGVYFRLTNFGDVLFDRVKAEFDRYNHIPLPVEFKLAELGGDIGLIGAAEFVREA